MASEPLVLAESKQISNQSSPTGALVALMSNLSEAQITSSQLNVLLASRTQLLHHVTRTTANVPMKSRRESGTADNVGSGCPRIRTEQDAPAAPAVPALYGP